ncbi:MAG: hypothetical protein ACRDKW_16135 [Actinomycetota bacterium]
MPVDRPHGGSWRVRWQDADTGKRLSRSFKTKAAAQRFEAQMVGLRDEYRAKLPEPLRRRVLRAQLGDRAEVEVDDLNPHGFYVYVLWPASDDRPLYIGSSTNVLARVGTHVVNPERRPRITRITLIKCFSAADMSDTEGRLIQFYEPELNLLGPDRRPLRRSMPLPEAVATIEDGNAEA